MGKTQAGSVFSKFSESLVNYTLNSKSDHFELPCISVGPNLPIKNKFDVDNKVLMTLYKCTSEKDGGKAVCCLCLSTSELRAVSEHVGSSRDTYAAMLDACFGIKVTPRLPEHLARICGECARRAEAAAAFGASARRTLERLAAALRARVAPPPLPSPPAEPHARPLIIDQQYTDANGRSSEQMLTPKQGKLDMSSKGPPKKDQQRKPPKMERARRAPASRPSTRQGRRDSSPLKRTRSDKTLKAPVAPPKGRSEDKERRRVSTAEIGPKKKTKKNLLTDVQCSNCKSSVPVLATSQYDPNGFICITCRRNMHMMSQTLVCPECGKEFYNRTTLQSHLLKCHRRAGTEDLRRAGTEDIRRPSQDDASVRRTRSPIYHRRQQKRFNCQYCDRSYIVARHLTTHMCTAHDAEKGGGGAGMYPCGVCKELFRSRKSLERHGKCHDTQDVYRCDACPKVFGHLKGLLEHSNRTHKTV